MNAHALGRLAQGSLRASSAARVFRRAAAAVTTLGFIAFGTLIAGCGSGGGGGVSSQVVSGTAATGAPLAGQVTLRDSSAAHKDKVTVIANDGTFAIDVTDMQAPFVLKASGVADGVKHTLYSFADKPGIANINPLSSAALASAAGVDDPAVVFDNPDAGTMVKVKAQLPTSVATLQGKIKPLLEVFNAANSNPVKDPYTADHDGLDAVLDNVKVSLAQGNLTITNANSDAIIFSARIDNVEQGQFTANDEDLPKHGRRLAAPTGVVATAGDGQITISWNAVENATSYDLYWWTAAATSSDDEETDDDAVNRIRGVTSPYVHTGLTVGTTYFYVIRAVNDGRRGPASARVSATTGQTTPPPAVPAAPTGVSATGGTQQTTISWPAVSGATSYNLYWSTTSGVTVGNGTKISAVTSPAVHTGLSDATTYYYIVTAVNSAGESAASVQVAATTLAANPPPPTVPSAPTGVAAAGGSNQVTLTWSQVTGAASYNVYWSTSAGVTTTGTKISGVSSPYVHTGLNASTAYYYIVTAVNSAGESAASAQVAATTNAPPVTVPPAPTGVAAVGGAAQATVTWNAATGATSYNLYWSATAGVTTGNGTKVAGVSSPRAVTGLADGTTYYFIVTAVNSAGESAASTQASATTNAPVPTVPAAPTGVAATGGAGQASVSWNAVTGATSYNLYWSASAGVTTGNGTKVAGVSSPYALTGLAASTTYYFVVTAVNSAGESAASAQASATTNAPVPTVPAAPTGVVATGGTAQVGVSWNAVSGATSYNVYWSTTSGVTTGNGTKVAGASSPFTLTGLADGTTYYFVVTAVNSAGESAASAQASATTTAPAIDGAALYTTYCSSCHGPLGASDKQGATAAMITAGIAANRGGMGTRFNATTGTLIKLTPAQIDAISLALQ